MHMHASEHLLVCVGFDLAKNSIVDHSQKISMVDLLLVASMLMWISIHWLPICWCEFWSIWMYVISLVCLAGGQAVCPSQVANTLMLDMTGNCATRVFHTCWRHSWHLLVCITFCGLDLSLRSQSQQETKPVLFHTLFLFQQIRTKFGVVPVMKYVKYTILELL